MKHVHTWRSIAFALVAIFWGYAAAPAQSAEQQPTQSDVRRSLLSGIQVSGFWRHSGDSGSEWQFTLRDPSGELLSRGSKASAQEAEAAGDPPSDASTPAPEQSLLLDVSRPLADRGPNTLLLRSAQTALGEGTGLERLFERIGLTDLATLSASPDFESLNLAYGVERLLPSLPGFRSFGWAHYLIGSVQAERRSPEEGTPDVSALGAITGYWGYADGWVLGAFPPTVMAEVEKAFKGGQASGAVVVAIGRAARAAGWLGETESPTLASQVGPGGRTYDAYAAPANQAAIAAFLEALTTYLARTPEWSLLDPTLQTTPAEQGRDAFLARLEQSLKDYQVTTRALELISEEGLTREEAFSRARGETATTTGLVTLEVLVEAVAPSALSVYHKVVTDERPVGDLSEALRTVIGNSFRSTAPADWAAWRSAILYEVQKKESTGEWRARWVFAMDASAFRNGGSDADAGAYVDARITWRPDPFQDYGVTLSHKQGKEESNRERRVNRTSLEFSYLF